MGKTIKQMVKEQESKDKAIRDLIDSLDEHYIKGAEALYHHLQDSVIGNKQDDVISKECLKFIKKRKKEISQ